MFFRSYPSARSVSGRRLSGLWRGRRRPGEFARWWWIPGWRRGVGRPESENQEAEPGYRGARPANDISDRERDEGPDGADCGRGRGTGRKVARKSHGESNATPVRRSAGGIVGFSGHVREFDGESKPAEPKQRVAEPHDAEREQRNERLE